MRCHRLEFENDQLRKRMQQLQPVIVMRDVASEGVAVQRRLTQMHEKLRAAVGSWAKLKAKEAETLAMARLVEVPRGDAARRAQVWGQVESAMNYDKFQFQRAEIEALKEELDGKLEELKQREAELDEKVVLAQSIEHERGGVSEGAQRALEAARGRAQVRRQEVRKEAVREEMEEVRGECELQIAKQRAYYNERYAGAMRRLSEARKEKDEQSLQVPRLKQQTSKDQEDLQLRYDGYERVSGQYDVLERQYQLLKKEYKALEKSKGTGGDEDFKEEDAAGQCTGHKKKRSRSRMLCGRTGCRGWMRRSTTTR